MGNVPLFVRTLAGFLFVVFGIGRHHFMEMSAMHSGSEVAVSLQDANLPQLEFTLGSPNFQVVDPSSGKYKVDFFGIKDMDLPKYLNVTRHDDVVMISLPQEGFDTKNILTKANKSDDEKLPTASFEQIPAVTHTLQFPIPDSIPAGVHPIAWYDRADQDGSDKQQPEHA